MKYFVLISLFFVFSCNMEYKQESNEVQDYHWLALTGTEEIRNDTIFTYNGKLGSDDFTSRIIQNVSDTSFSYQYFDEESNDWLEATATFETTMKDQIPYLIVYFHNSVSMFTRKRVCPIDLERIFQ